MVKYKFQVQASTDIIIEADNEYEAIKKINESDDLYYEELLESVTINEPKEVLEG